MKTLAGLGYDELLTRAAAVMDLPKLAGDKDDEPDLPDGSGPAPFGAVAVTSKVWLRERANRYLEGIPDLPDFDDPIRRLDDDTKMAVLSRALLELDYERVHARAWNPEAHKRYPKGHPKAGKFRPMVDLLKEAINAYDGSGKHPFEGFNREQLMKAAKARGITLSRGEDKDSIATKLLADLGGTAKTAPGSKTPAKKAAKAATPKVMPKPPGPDDGLDELDEHRLKSLSTEFDVPKGSRDKMIAGLRAAGAVSPAVRIKRIETRQDLNERLASMGRRQPADADPLDRAAEKLANGDDPKVVAKALRAEADKVTSNEDAQTLRHLASDLTRKKATIPAYINDKGNVDLRKLAEMNGIDLKRWMPQDTEPAGRAGWSYRDRNVFHQYLQSYIDELADPTDPRAKIVRRMREEATRIRDRRAEALAGRGPMNWPNRDEYRKHFLAGGLDAANDFEKLADLVEAAKVPPKKRGKTLGGTTLGEVVPVDESRFRRHTVKDVVRHRGQTVPASFVHKGFAAALMKNPNRPHRPGLSPPESNALDLYTVAVVADGLNGSLRKGRNFHGEVALGQKMVDLDEVSRDLDSALADSVLTKDTVLWRGAVPTTSDYRRLVPGAIYTDAGYLSTSTDEKGARYVIDWRKGKAPAGRKPMLMKILAPAGTNAALGHEAVDEALLPRGQELRVVRVDESGDVPVVVMEVVPRNPEPGRVRGRSLVEDLDYDEALKAKKFASGRGDHSLGYIQKAQGFDGPPQVVPPSRVDELIADGATELFRAIGGDSVKYTEEFRTGPLFPGLGVYGSGTYTSPDRNVAAKYGDEETMLRMALRRDARVIRYDELLKLRPQTGVTATAAKLSQKRQAELDAVDPADAAAVAAIIDRYAKLAARQGSRSQIGNDVGRVAALLGYDAIVVPADYRGRGSKHDGQPEYIILNRTAVYVEEAS